MLLLHGTGSIRLTSAKSLHQVPTVEFKELKTISLLFYNTKTVLQNFKQEVPL